LGEELFAQTLVSHTVTTSAAFRIYLAADARTFAVRWVFRKKKRQRRLKFDKYIRGLQALDKAAHRIIGHHSQGDPNKVTVAFGSARFNGIKGSPSAPTKMLHQRLRNVHRRRCIVADVDEFRTSKMCPECGSKVCNVREPNKEDTKSEAKEDVRPSLIYSLKACPKCETVFNRDDMGACLWHKQINAFNIALAFLHLNRTGLRPPYLQRNNPLGEGKLLTIPRKQQHPY
jgi:hypothetical protein